MDTEGCIYCTKLNNPPVTVSDLEQEQNHHYQRSVGNHHQRHYIVPAEAVRLHAAGRKREVEEKDAESNGDWMGSL